MTSMDIICSGWLTKSPPEKRLLLESWSFLKPKWRRRFFVLHKPKGSLPGHYAFEYYKDEQCRKYVNHIDLEQCEEVTASLKSPLYKYLFLLRTKQKGHDRTYYLSCDSESEMSRWVECLCSVCNLKVDDEQTEAITTPIAALDLNLSNGDVAPAPPQRTDSISPTRMGSSPGSNRTTSPEFMALSTTPNNTSYEDSIDGLSTLGNEYVSDPSESEKEGYIPLEECYSGSTQNKQKQEKVLKKQKQVNRYSRDSMPDEIAPLPPVKEGAASHFEVSGEYGSDIHVRPESYEWDPNATYDSPPPRVMPPKKPARDRARTTPHELSVAMSRSFDTYDSPPIRTIDKKVSLTSTVPLPQKHRSESLHASSYSVPQPSGRQESISSSSASVFSHGTYSEYELDQCYDTPSRFSLNDIVRPSMESMRFDSQYGQGYDYPASNESINKTLDAHVPPPPRPPKTENVYYNQCDIIDNERKSNSIEIDGEPSLDDVYDFPKAIEDPQDPPPPPPCHGRKSVHKYINAASGIVIEEDQNYLDMQGARTSQDHPDVYASMLRHDENEMYTNLPVKKSPGVGRISLSQSIPLPTAQKSAGDVYYNLPTNNKPVQSFDSSELYMSPPNNTAISIGPPVDRRNKPKIAPLLINNNIDDMSGINGMLVQDTYQILPTPKTKCFKRDSSIDWPSPRPSPGESIRLPTKRREVPDSSSSDEDDDDEDHTNHAPRKVYHVQLKNTPPPPRRNPQQVEYLELALDEASDSEKSPHLTRSPPAHCVSPTDYKEIDFLKTDALKETKKAREYTRKGSDTG